MIDAQTLPELIENASRTYASRLAYIWRPQFRALKYTWSDMGRLARQVAHILEDHGIHKGDRVVIWAVNSPFWVAAFYGCQMKGAVAVPLMPQNTQDFVRLICDFTEARLILKSASLNPGETDTPQINIEEALLAGDIEESFARAKVSPEDPAQILFTSGTTGNPKGVVHKHSNLLANARDIFALNILRDNDHLMSFLPLAHVFEQILSLYVCPMAGVPVTMAASLSGLHIRMCLVEDSPTFMTSVPEFLKLTVERIEAKAEQQGKLDSLHSLYHLAPRLPMWLRRRTARPILRQLGGRLRLVVSGGSALDPDVGRKWEAFGIVVLQGYGATETSPVISVNRPSGRKVESVGLPLPSVQVRIASDGEILARGPNVVDGYYKRPEETADRFKDGWYYTDDLGEIDKDGHLHIKGRKKFLIVTPAGENIYPEDLEAELHKEPEVKSATVIAWKPGGRFEVHAVLLPNPGEAIENAQAVIERVNVRLQPHQRIQGVSVWDGDDFPRTVTRKVKKNEVLAWLENRQNGSLTRATAVAAGAVELAIAQATGIPTAEITPDKRLEADLKMDSLGRVTLAGILEEELGVFIDEGQLQPNTTVAQIKEIVEKREQKEERYEFDQRPLTPRAIFWRGLWQKLLVWPFVRLFATTHTRGLGNLEGLQGPILFYPNHVSPIDGAIVLKALPSRFQSKTAIAAATDVVFENPAVKSHVRTLQTLFNVYPFSRESQVRSSLEYTGRLLDRGFSIMLFPEGHMARDGKLQPIKLGAGLIAVEMGVPVVPIGVAGVEKMVPANAEGLMMPRRASATVVIGKPLTFIRETSYEDAATRIHEALRELLPEQYRDNAEKAVD
ncbi:MAG: AMP-binding protein [Armatimonadetes bacterium]|nr:AMP-binding protein [Armatimonadota bacterium]